MADPLTGVADLDQVPADVIKVKLVVSSRKRKFDSGHNVLEPVEHLNEADGFGLGRDSNLVSPKKRKRTLKSLNPRPAVAEPVSRLGHLTYLRPVAWGSTVELTFHCCGFE